MIRENTRSIMVGNIQIGHQNKCILQSMCNTPTKDVEKTVDQINRLVKNGCQIVRLAILDQADAMAIKQIKAQTNVPLVADIHFNHQLALIAIENGIDKVRINPGNIGSKENVKAIELLQDYFDDNEKMETCKDIYYLNYFYHINIF